MSLQPHPVEPVPPLTLRVATAAFPKGNLYLKMRDEFGTFYHDHHFANLFGLSGPAAIAPWRLALVTLMQFVEGLCDRDAADAVRARIDWKYALSLELEDSGFDFSVLSEFRTRLLKGQAEQQLFELMLEEFKHRGLLKARGRQRTDSTHVLAAIRVLNRLERVGETLRAALNSLAVVAPDWLRAQAQPEWFKRYSSRVDNYQLPKAEAARQALATTIGEDGYTLLAALENAGELGWLNQVPAVKTLREVWNQQYTTGPEPIKWREVKELGASGAQITSPYDIEARYANKRSIEWVGYKVHLTETCDEQTPHLITNVETTIATIPDDALPKPIHEALAKRALLPSEHFVDAGYTDAEVLASSQRDHQVKIIGPLALDPSWQARAGEGFDRANFVVDWEAESVRCPKGKRSLSWIPNTDKTKPGAVQVRFSRKDCSICEDRVRCTKSKIEPRLLLLLSREEYELVQKVRQEQTTAEFKATYGVRAGIEGTLSQGVRGFDLRHTRYIGLAKTHLQQLVSAAAINLVRVVAWLDGTPQAKTRISHFAALAQPAV